MAKTIAAPKTRLTIDQRKKIVKTFTAVLAAKQVDVLELVGIINSATSGMFDAIYDTPEKKAAVQVLIDAKLYNTVVTTNMDKVIPTYQQFREDTGFSKFHDLQISFGLQYDNQRSMPIERYQDIAILEIPHDLIHRFMSNPPKGSAGIVTTMEKRLISACKINKKVLDTYQAVVGMIKAAKFAEDLIDLLPELAPIIIEAAKITVTKALVTVPTIEMRKVMAELAPIDVKDMK